MITNGNHFEKGLGLNIFIVIFFLDFDFEVVPFWVKFDFGFLVFFLKFFASVFVFSFFPVFKLYPFTSQFRVSFSS